MSFPICYSFVIQLSCCVIREKFSVRDGIVTWRLKAGIVESEKTVIARQRRDKTLFRGIEYAGINQRVTQRVTRVFMATANNKGISSPREATSGRDTESRDRIREVYRLFKIHRSSIEVFIMCVIVTVILRVL
jgi:hypothetical protein